MSIPHHQYFRRGSDGTRVLEHGEIRELMLAPREGQLGLQCRMRHIMTMGGSKYGFDCVFSLRNEGRVAVRAPFVRATGARILPAFEHGEGFIARRNSNGDWGVYTNRDSLVHVGDELDIAKIVTGFQLHPGYEGNSFIGKIIETHNEGAFTIRTLQEMNEGQKGVDRVINSELTFGGENAPMQTLKLAMDKWTMFNLMTDELK